MALLLLLEKMKFKKFYRAPCVEIRKRSESPFSLTHTHTYMGEPNFPHTNTRVPYVEWSKFDELT